MLEICIERWFQGNWSSNVKHPTEKKHMHLITESKQAASTGVIQYAPDSFAYTELEAKAISSKPCSHFSGVGIPNVVPWRDVGGPGPSQQ